MPTFDKRGIMVDCSRNAVPTAKTLKKFINLMKQMDYNMLMLYTEDTYEVKGQPYFGYMRGKYTLKELKETVMRKELNAFLAFKRLPI